MNIATRITEFLAYLMGKRSEVKDLGVSDVVMAKTILDIHRKRIGKEIVSVPLFSVKPIHPLDRENSMRATEERVKILRENKEAILDVRDLTTEFLMKYLPSVSNIKVVGSTPDRYLSFEGNGRLGALQQVFSPSDQVSVHVERYLFRNPKKIVRRLERVRRLNGLED